MNTRQIKNQFNRTAESLGCKARISGNAKKIRFEMWTGAVDSKGYEIVVGIDSTRFGSLIEPFPQLHNS